MKTQSKVVEYDFEASEFNCEIAPGKIIKAWGFNKQLPGPVLRANAGDTLVVRVTNNLSEPTTIHWHGIRLPASMDGTDGVQKQINPGEVFEYRFIVPDAGTFWYHSHTNETVQMERGIITEERLGSCTALLLSALIFGAAHLINPDSSIISAICTAVVGFVLGAAYIFSRSLWMPIAIHFSWNFMQSGIFGVITSGNDKTGGLFNLNIVGSEYVTGGAYGPEGTIQAVLLCIDEVIGQLPRLLLGGVKSFVGKVPIGNTGGANVPGFQPIEIPEELKQIMNK
ncbi:unnamed protein product [Rotaria sordida]|uniref:Uncharacterized protein n=1 Tax=Rotaria sordida TaxID=392033 RepID=A0A813WPX0_9BILA|nr:unnamed protein product [Rotaria sordida]CAF0916614.1 unnamed protein product [Rotaria sordida]